MVCLQTKKLLLDQEPAPGGMHSLSPPIYNGGMGVLRDDTSLCGDGMRHKPRAHFVASTAEERRMGYGYGYAYDRRLDERNFSHTPCR